MTNATNTTYNGTQYNGWTNYETWAVKLHMDNDPQSYSYWTEQAREIARTSHPSEFLTRYAMAEMQLAEALKNDHEEGAPELSGAFGELLRHALAGVDWEEIATSLLEEVDGEIWAAEPEDW